MSSMLKRYLYSLALAPLLLLCGCDGAPPTAETAPETPAGQAPQAGVPTAAPGAQPPGIPAAPQGAAPVPIAAASPPPDPSFTPLPSPEQVKRAQPIGQLDPFRPLSQEIRDLVVKPKASPSGPASPLNFRPPKPAPLQPPPGLEITGLIGAVGRPEAVISYQGANGTVRVGDVGSATGTAGPNATNLLPEGWRVASIDVTRGAIVLQFKGQTTKKQI
ncbi:MAG: hypothetical protein ACK46L_15385 [Synechococcaceae cyanobacterium]